ncbi:MAG: polyhydroxyalkanoate synthesis regulator DNA-binding domain-containing protein [Archangium sp.]|nr:polyhydroxyalkanoate synthesis regulator DNA-binding domain-containing protein [Archangium sp.]
MSEAEPAREPKVIKRYTNRKLYDTVESRYVTLDEIAEMVKQGVEVKIVDNRTKEDLTSVTLAQIVFEEEKKKNQMPLSVLREIIRQPGERLNDFISTQVSPRVDAIKQEATGRINTLLGREAEGDLTPASLVQQSQKIFEGWQQRVDERVKSAVEGVVGNLPALGRDLNTLVQRIEQLEQKIAALENEKPRKK